MAGGHGHGSQEQYYEDQFHQSKSHGHHEQYYDDQHHQEYYDDQWSHGHHGHHGHHGPQAAHGHHGHHGQPGYDQGYDQSSGEAADAKPVDSAAPMSMAPGEEGFEELPSVEGPENIPLEAGGGLPPPEAEDGFEAEGPEVEEVEAPLAAPYSDENEGGDQAAFEEGSGEGPPLMLVNSEGQNLLAKEKTRQLINKVKILSKTLQAKLPAYDEGSDLPEMEDEMREICRAREVEINKLDQARTAAEIARLENEEEPGAGDEAVIEEEAKKIREEWPGDEFDEHYGYGPPQGEADYGYGPEYGPEGGYGHEGGYGYEDYGGHGAHAEPYAEHGAAAGGMPVAHAMCPVVVFPTVRDRCRERFAGRSRHARRHAEFLCQVY